MPEDARLEQQYGVGARLLSRMGYKPGHGLGRTGEGIATPLEPVQRASTRSGLGAQRDVCLESAEDESSSDGEILDAVQFRRVIDPPSIVKLRAQLRTLQLKLAELYKTQQLLDERETRALQVRETIVDNASTLQRRIHAILALDDDSLAEALLAHMLKNHFNEIQSRVTLDTDATDNEAGHFLAMFLPVVPLLDLFVYRLGTQLRLNLVQTVIYEALLPQLVAQLELNSEDVSNVLTILKSAEQLLRYVDAWHFVLQKYGLPPLLDKLERMSFHEPLDWIIDFHAILDKDLQLQIERNLAAKLNLYLSSWYHRDFSNASLESLKHLQEILGETFHTIVNEQFLPRFLNQLWDRHFDPVATLENSWLDENDSGTLYFIRMLRNYRPLFKENQYQVILKHVFGEIYAIILQWFLYCRGSSGTPPGSWFKWLINHTFDEDPITKTEAKYISDALSYIDDWQNGNWRLVNETYADLAAELGLTQAEQDDSAEMVNYNIQNIPLRKVGSTFRELLQEYCEQKGYLISKLPGEYTQIKLKEEAPSSLVPLFQVSDGHVTVKVAIKYDILWIQQENIFKPIYIWELKL